MMRSTLLFLAAALLSRGATLRDVTVTEVPVNGTIINQALVQGQMIRQNVATTPVTTNGNLTQFTNHYGIFSGIRVAVDGPDFRTILPFQYQISFTVDDPGNQGYILYAEALARGYVTAAYDFENSVPGSTLNVTMSNFEFEALAPNGNWISLPDLRHTGEDFVADENVTNLNNRFFRSSAAITDVVFGTRAFQFRVTSQVEVWASPGAAGEIALRMGHNPDPSLSTLVVSQTPGVDESGLDELGHFVPVSMFRQQCTSGEIPEPSTWLTAGLGAAMILGRSIKWRKQDPHE